VFITKIAIATIAIASTTMGVTNLLPADPPAPALSSQALQQQQAMKHPPAVDIGQLARAFHH
jgi:hypothetical protein